MLIIYAIILVMGVTGWRLYSGGGWSGTGSLDGGYGRWKAVSRFEAMWLSNFCCWLGLWWIGLTLCFSEPRWRPVVCLVATIVGVFSRISSSLGVQTPLIGGSVGDLVVVCATLAVLGCRIGRLMFVTWLSALGSIVSLIGWLVLPYGYGLHGSVDGSAVESY